MNYSGLLWDLSVSARADDTLNLSAHYTPEALATSLARWAIRLGNERVLEPSVGGGALIDAAIKQAHIVANGTPQMTLVACDINGFAVQRLREGRDGVEFVVQDFLTLRPENFHAFDVVIANPPFTRNHSLDEDYRSALRKRFGISGAAGLWVPFIKHASNFLRPGGRLVSLVPAAATFTKYGADFLKELGSHFAHTEIFALDSRPMWDTNAEERGAVLVAEGRGTGASVPSRGRYWNGSTQLHTTDKSSAFFEVSSGSVPLSSVGDLSIGIVTGRNKHFLLSEAERVEKGISLESVVPVASRASHLQGITISRADLSALAHGGQKTWLLAPDILEPAVAAHLDQVTHEDRETVAWFRKRKPWWRVDVGRNCDAVFTYMNHLGPRLVLAEDSLHCTNTLHRLRLKDGLDPWALRSAAVSMISTFGQLAAEKIGRVYGGGVLKFELAETRALPVLVSEAAGDQKLFEKLDALIKDRKLDEARLLADRVVLHGRTSGSKTLHRSLEQSLKEARHRRFQAKGAL